MKLWWIIALLCFPAVYGFGQELHFSQFHESPLNLNPANTGHFSGDWRISNNYRMQWAPLGDPFVTASIAYDQPLNIYGQRVGVGAAIFTDQSGMAGLSVFQAAGSAASSIDAGQHRLRGGVQLAYIAKTFTTANLTFPDQFDWDMGLFNSALQTSAVGYTQQSRFFNLNAGAGWSRQMRSWTPDIGIAFHHLNRPTDSFFGTSERLPTKITVNGAAEIDLNTSWYLWPRVLYQQQAKATQTTFGTFAGYRLPYNKVSLKSMYAGPVLRTGINRNADALALVAGLRFKNLQLGVSYDYTVSNLGPAIKNQGALEFSLIYIPNPVVDRISIPCDRY